MNGMSRQDRRISLICRHRSAQEYQDNEFVLDVLILVRSKHILSTYLSVLQRRRPGKWDVHLGREIGRSRGGPPLVPKGTSPLTKSSCPCTARGKGWGGWVSVWGWGGRGGGRTILVLNLWRKTSEIRPRPTYIPFFYKALDTVCFSCRYARFHCVPPV